ncbi:MAG: UDP-N-acetylenolpyruvoylglucosamine reductase [Gammaproteobacteria bacterium]|nr:MAG: UDP-N-acetylenolpyruvoylglucosamine reductase [Gammaproteobacteria bacterium]
MDCDKPLAAHNTLALNACAALYGEAKKEQDIVDAIALAKAKQLPLIPLGEGSNVVFARAKVHALVLKIALRGVRVLKENEDSVLLRVAAGENWHQLVCDTVAKHWYGLENLALIPGLVGAAPVQNIGAYGVEVKQFIDTVHGLCINSQQRLSFSRDDCEFAYRSSVFKGALQDKIIITAVDFKLTKRARAKTHYPALAHFLKQQGIDNPSPQNVLDAVISIRRQRLPDPNQTPNAGSFFHNPVVDKATAQALLQGDPNMPQYPAGDGVKLAAAYLIEQCGFKGKLANGVGVHPQHALVLINPGGAGGETLLAFANEIQRVVLERYGVALTIEPRVYRDES